jgi:hypothetical protein
MWLLAIPLLVILLVGGLIVGVIGLIFGLIGLLVGVVKTAPWLLILLGAWLLFRPRGHRRWHQYPDAQRPRHWDRHREPRRQPARPQMQPVPSRPSSPSVQQRRPAPRPQTPSQPAPVPKRELPIDVQVKVEQIRRKADMLLGYADRFPPFSQDLYLVRQTTADYLPRTTSAYLALPGSDDPIVPATGKTALQELRDQLLLLDAKLDEITQDLQRQDLDHLLANRRFLEERFRMRDPDRPTGPVEGEIDAA